MEKTLVDTLVVKQDIGRYEPRYKKAIIDFWSDGTVTWRAREAVDLSTDSYVGDPDPDRLFN
jgi:hypothetical protein